MPKSLYCKIFIDSELEYKDLFTLIENSIAGHKEAVTYISSDWCEVCVQKNKEFNIEQYSRNCNDFIYWPYYLDIEPKDVNKGDYIRSIANLIDRLRVHCKGIIIACDFEDEIR